jgi:hypothetical protein
MDKSKPPIPTSEIGLRPASDCKSAVVDAVPAGLRRSDELSAPGRQADTDPSEPRRNDPTEGPSVVVCYRNEQEVSRGFLIALRAMGWAVVEQPPALAKPPVARAEP